MIRPIFRSVSALIGISLAVFFALDAGRVTGSAEWGNLGLILIAATGVGGLYSWHFYIKPLRIKPHPAFPFHQVEDDRALILQRAAGEGKVVDADQARLFALAVVEPSEIRTRVVEDHTPSRRTLDQRVTVDIGIPRRLIKDAGRQLYVPALLVPKGEMHDDLQVWDQDGRALSTLSYREYLKVAAAVLRILLATAYKIKSGERLPPAASAAELLAIRAIMKRREDMNARTDLTSADQIENLVTPATGVHEAALIKLASRFVRQLIVKYAVVVIVKVDSDESRFRFAYSQTLIPELKLTRKNSKRRWSLGTLFRLGLGAKAVELTVDISLAATCQSYHLHVNAPDELYLAKQEALELGSLLTRPARNAPTLPHCRFRRRLGQPHGHFYSRYMPQLDGDEKPQVTFRYLEVPPGSIMRGATTATAAFLIIWIVALVNSKFSDGGTDAPAFLLAFPALAATWLGFETPTQRLFGGTLAARLTLIVTAFLCLAATGLFMWHKCAGANFQWPTFPLAWPPLGVTDLGWGILTLIAMANMLQAVHKFVIRTWEYQRVLVKSVV